MLNRKLGLVTVALVSILISTGAAATAQRTFVASYGSDANPCTQSQPCLTIGHAVDVATAGATINVGEGTYAEQVSITKQLTL